MLNKEFFRHNCDPFLKYLNRAGSVGIVIMDRQFIIKDCNDYFLRMIENDNRPCGDHLSKYLAHEDKTFMKQLIREETDRIRLTIVGQKGSRISMSGYFTEFASGYVLFLERAWIEDDEVIKEISKLNNEMANMTRELNKKNIELQRANARINNLLRTDSLTAIANRLYFMEYYSKIYASALRHGNALSLIMADLDYFKKINDQYGHQVGDEVLVAFATILKENSRSGDLAARYGGEEFVVLLMQTDAKGGKKQAERIRKNLEDKEIGSKKIKVTASFGVAELKSGDNMDDLLRKADEALYRAKGQGRNRVVV
ncbi:MAG: GGDEF domain-containing protein [Bacillota bacterium]